MMSAAVAKSPTAVARAAQHHGESEKRGLVLERRRLVTGAHFVRLYSEDGFDS
jgi:hypothetical protein